MIRKSYVETPSGQFHLRRVEGPGAPLMMLHRTPADSSAFEKMLACIAGRRAAVAFDTPGFGQSFRPAGLPRAPDYAAWFLDAIDAIGVGSFHLCAHHTGTHFAAELAALAPERTCSLLLSGVLYATETERMALRTAIGDAPAIDADGAYIMATWAIVKSLLSPFEPDLVHAELLGALGAPIGRNQAFGAILAQDFPALLAQLACPVAIAQGCDDPLASQLERVHAAHPLIPIFELGACGMAAPERQASQYAEIALAFAAANDATPTSPLHRSGHD